MSFRRMTLAARIAAPSRVLSTLLVLGLLAAPRPARCEDAPTPAADPPRKAAKAETVPGDYLHRQWAGTDLVALAAALRRWKQEHGGAWPEHCLDDIAPTMAPAPTTDPWGSPYRCELTPPARVLSVGPDGRPGNADDVVIPVEGRAAVNAAAALASSASVAASAPAGSMVAPEARRTFEDLTRLASGLASFKAANGFYPVTEGADQLERWLVPDHVAPSRWVGHDGWDRPWRYRVTDVGSSYSLASAGADGRWESLVPPHPAGAPDDGDIVVSDGVFLRWPAGLSPPTAAPAAGVKAASDGASDPAPEAPADLTAWRLRRLGASVAAARHDAGRYPESDDAPRLFGDLGSRVQPVDGWGRELDYLSLASGSSFVLVSAGADGIQERSTEDYARGAPPQGDDILVRDGVLSPGTPPPAP